MNKSGEMQAYREAMGEDAYVRQTSEGLRVTKKKCNCNMRHYPHHAENPSSFHRYTCPFYRP